MKKLLCALLGAALLLAPGTALAEDDAFLYENEAAVETYLDRGPWYYASGDLTVTVHHRLTNTAKFAVADIQSRGSLFYGGYSKGDMAAYGTELPNRLTRHYGAVLGITGDYMEIATNPKGAVIRDGKVYYDENRGDTLAILPEGSLAVYPSGTVRAQELLDLGVRDSFTFGPILVMDGRAYEPALNHPLADINRRACIAQIAPGHYLAIATSSGFTNAELQTLFLSYGVELAYSMDGGHSTTMVFLGEQLNKQPFHYSMKVYQRPLSDMLLIGKTALCPGLDDPVRYNDLMWLDPPVPEETAAPEATEQPPETEPVAETEPAA